MSPLDEVQVLAPRNDGAWTLIMPSHLRYFPSHVQSQIFKTRCVPLSHVGPSHPWLL